ncbi:CYTOCHROME P450 82C3-RELATED [Salix purpurea]|uniref:CYTOCHROME P450 82C3-RELATED n=1 Tax=Salix purpurea TaxID=77065 RepID=A0A9Q0SQZ5_SALPP|nr:CYTOCHROME P450 82C3-RELATED [Salix purpurea]
MESLYHLLALLFFLFFVIKTLFRHRQNLPPSPFALPIIGHLHLLRHPQSLQTLSSQYGPILFLKFGFRPVLVVSSPSAVEECFTENDIIFANRPQSMAGDYLTYNYTALVWAPYGHLWRSLRRISAIELFASKSLQKSSTICGEEVCSLLRRLLQVNNGVTAKVDLQFLFSLLTLNVMMKLAAGKPCIDEEVAVTEVEKQSFQEFKEIFSPGLGMNICDFIPILRLVGYKGLEKRTKKLQRTRDTYLQHLIDETRLRRRSSSFKTAKQWKREEKSSVIETFLSLQDLEPEFLTDTVIKTEIDEHVGYERLLKESDIAKLPYLRCVINETLRLYPPAPRLLPHFSSGACTVGGFDIPRGTTLMVNAWAIHRDPKLWEEADEFMPERFEAGLGEPEGFKYIPFGTGRRVCPGAKMGLQIVSLTLGAVVQCFEWDKDGPVVDMSHSPGLTLSKARPLEALCTPRRDLITIL